MDWNNAYLIPLYNALLIPVLIFGLGLVVEGFGNLLTAVISLFFGGSVAFFVRNRLTFIGSKSNKDRTFSCQRKPAWLCGILYER